MVRFNLTRFLPYIIPVGLLLNLILGSYFWILMDKMPVFECDGNRYPMIYSRNFFTIGLPSIVAGIWIRLKERPIKTYKILIITVILLIALLIEHNLMKKITGFGDSCGDIIFLTFPCCIAIFILALNVPEIKATRWMATLGKKYSLGIYLWHLLVHAVMMLFAVRLLISPDSYDYWRFPLTVILSIFVIYGSRKLFKVIKPQCIKKRLVI